MPHLAIKLQNPDGTPAAAPTTLTVSYGPADPRESQTVTNNAGVAAATVPDNATTIQVSIGSGYASSPAVLIYADAAVIPAAGATLVVWPTFSITGTVLDENGQAIDGVSVSLSGEWKPGSHTDTAGVTSTGAYVFPTVQGGQSYTISSINPGFDAVGAAEITLTLERDATDVNFTLKKTEEFSNLEAALLTVFGAGGATLLAMIIYAAGKRVPNWLSRCRSAAEAKEATDELPMSDVVEAAEEVGGLSDSSALESLAERTSSMTFGELEPIDLDVLSTSVSESEYSATIQDAVAGVRNATSLSDFVDALNGLDRSAYRCAVQTLAQDIDRVSDLYGQLMDANAVKDFGADATREAISGIFAENGYTLESAENLLDAGGYAIDAEILAEATGLEDAGSATSLLEMILDLAFIVEDVA